MTAWDRDGTLAAPAASGKLVRLKLDEAATNLRCVEESGREPRAEPITVAVEQIQSMGGLATALPKAPA